MRLFLFAALFGSLVAQAEVKPHGTLLENLCGAPSKSLTVCLATKVGYPGDYLTLTTIREGKRILKVRDVTRSGGGKVTYSAWAPGPGAAAVMVNYELVVRAGKGTLLVNGRAVGLPRFHLEVIYHTQSVGF